MATWLPLLAQGEERVLHLLARRRRRTIDRLMRRLTHLGDAAITVPIALVLLLGSVPPLGSVGVVVAFTLTVSHLMVQALKRTVTRPRPRFPAGFHSLIEAPDRFSFPSGHAASSLSVALPLAEVLPYPFAGGLVVVAVLVGGSRCYLGVHYPSDVAAGWALAGIAFLAASPVLGWLGLLAAGTP
jgi:undecaprenyl-diphosphatase